MSGNPFIGNMSNEPYCQASDEMAKGSHIKRLNELHQFNKDETIN